MQRLFQKIHRNADGQTTVEYAVVLVFVIGLAAASLTVLEPSIVSFFTTAADRLTTVALG
jgi:Flp pilus assembly pilin Flp